MDFLVEFIKRNAFTIIIIATLLVAMPWLGYIFVIPLILVIVFALIVAWQIHKMRSRLNDEIRRQQGQQRGWQQQPRHEGEVTIVQTEQTEQKVSDDVGEYVDFKEIDNDKK